MDHVGVSDFTERRLARLAGSADARPTGATYGDLFPTAYSHPVPSPDGGL
ncbi:MAG: hypothetical protein JWR58_5528, partial [Pseudonocardia sp.]|nr:hypothetical protein [Pseudonocardia sp.]